MDSIISVGVDIVSVKRVKRLYDRYGERFLNRVYTETEKRSAENRPDVGQFLSGRFAVKEAVLKVLGCGLFSGIKLTEIEVASKESGEPCCELSGTALEKGEELGIERVLVSISHCDEYAISQATGVGNGSGAPEAAGA